MSTPIEILVVGKDGASVPLHAISRELSALGKTAQTETAHTTGFFKTVAAAAGGFLAANFIGGIGRQFAGFARDAIQESRDAAHGLAQTEAAIKSTGGAAGVTAQQIVDLSGSLSHTTLFSDDAIQSMSNLMLTFTGVRDAAGEGNDIFTQSNKLALDMAQAMGTDAAGGAIQLGKALNDPVAGITALTRVGVTFSEEQKKQIKSMAEHNNVIGAQKIVLAELTKEFGGSAAAALKADGGYHLFQQRLADVEQTIGDALQPALQGVMEVLSGPFLDAVTTVGTALAGELTDGIAWLSGTALPALSAAWYDLQMSFAFNGVGGVIQAIIGDVGRFVPALKPVTDFISRNFWGVWDTAASAIGIARDAFLTFTDALSGNWVDASGILSFHQAIGEIGLALHDFAGWIVTIGSELASGDWSGAFDTLTTGLTNFGATIGTAVSTWAGEFAAWVPTAIANVQAALPGIWNAVSTWIADQAGPILTQMGVWGSQFIAWVPTAIADIRNALPGIWTTVSTWIGDQVQPLLTKVNEWGSQFVAWVPTAVTDLQTALPGIWTAVSTWIGDQTATITTKLGDWAGAFIAWIGPAIPGFLEAVGAFATGIGTAIATGVPIIVEKAKLWATELVAWIQRDAVPKLEPAFTAFLTTLGAQADRAKTVLSTKGNEAGIALVNGMKLGWANAPVETSNQMIKVAAEIDKNRPLIMAAMKVLGEAGIKSMIESMSNQTTIQLPSIGKQIEVALLGFIPALGIAAAKLGISIAESWYKGAYDQFQKLFPGLNALGTSMGKFLADGLNTAGTLITTSAKALGKAIIDGIASGLGDIATWVAGKVIGGLAGAITLVRAHQRIQSPSKVWAEQVGTPLAEGIGAGFVAGMGKVTPAMVKQLEDATRVISAAADAVTKGTTAFPLLKTFKAPDASSIAAFTESTRQIVASLGTVAQTFKSKWLEQATVFMDAAGKGLGIISSGVDGLNKLRTFRSPSIANINAFTDAVIVIVQSLGTAAQIFKAEWLTHAQTFFDTAGKGIGIIGAGVDGLTKLRTFKAPSIANINAFTDTVTVIVQSLGTVAQIFKDGWLAKASEFEETAGKGLAIIGNGVDGLTKLRDFKAPSIAAINAFTDTVTLVVQSLGTVAQTFKEAWLAKASVFADAAAKGIGIIGGAIEGFTKLSTYKGLTTGTLEVFATDMQTVMTAMIGIANDLGTKGPAAAAVFGDAVGRTIAPIGTAIDTFTKLKNYKGVARNAVLLIGNDMVGVMNTLGIIAGNMSGPGVAAAMAFADSANVVFGALKTALDALSSVADISKKGDAIKGGLGVLAQGITDLVAVIASVDWSGALGTWQTSFTTLFTGIMETVFLPWQTMTNDFFSGAGFGFIGAASVGINSAGNGLATSAGNVGGAAGAALVGALRGNLGGVDAFVGAVNASLGHIEREITIHVKTVYDP